MAKKKQVKVEQVPQPIPEQKVTEIVPQPASWIDKLSAGYLPYILIMLFSIGLYANTFHHQYALDDEIVICKNEYVLQGISGLSDIFTKDLYDSFYKQMNTKAQLSGGRYRPLSIASFAIEQ